MQNFCFVIYAITLIRIINRDKLLKENLKFNDLLFIYDVLIGYYFL